MSQFETLFRGLIEGLIDSLSWKRVLTIGVLLTGLLYQNCAENPSNSLFESQASQENEIYSLLAGTYRSACIPSQVGSFYNMSVLVFLGSKYKQIDLSYNSGTHIAPCTIRRSYSVVEGTFIARRSVQIQGALELDYTGSQSTPQYDPNNITPEEVQFSESCYGRMGRFPGITRITVCPQPQFYSFNIAWINSTGLFYHGLVNTTANATRADLRPNAFDTSTVFAKEIDGYTPP